MMLGDALQCRRGLPLGALLLLVGLCSQPATSLAAKGDCGQPTSSGSGPSTSDALAILKRAVGLVTACDVSSCVCDANGSGTVTPADALLVLKKAVGQPVDLACVCALFVSDDFNDDSRDPARWGDDFVSGNGELDETSHVLEYTCANSTTDDESLRPWVGGEFPYVADWEVQLDVTNLTVPDKDNQFDSIGIDVIDASDGANEFYAELYASRVGGPPARTGFYGELYKDDTYLASADTFGIGVTTGAVKLAFSASTKVVTLFYDADTADGYTWVQFGSFGLAGSGGADGNTDWGFSNTDRFAVAVYGYSSSIVIAPGKMRGDNFLATGGLLP